MNKLEKIFVGLGATAVLTGVAGSKLSNEKARDLIMNVAAWVYIVGVTGTMLSYLDKNHRGESQSKYFE